MLAKSLVSAFPQLLRTFSSTAQEAPLLKTALYNFHVKNGGNMVPFAGYLMPVQYKEELIPIHHWARKSAVMWDVGHMGQCFIRGKDREAFMEYVTPGDVKALAFSQARLSQFLNEKGTIIDDCMYTQRGSHIYLVINAACKENDIKHMREIQSEWRAKGKDVSIEPILDRALIALQGPKAVVALQRLVKPDLSKMRFMTSAEFKIGGIPCYVSRYGYTGLDGFEIAVKNKWATKLATLFLHQPEIKCSGLGVRDSMRLESGLCLYGHDIDETTTPIEGNLLWTITKRRRKEGGFIGYDKIFDSKTGQPFPITRLRTGMIVTGAPARQFAEIFDKNTHAKIGMVTSGTFSPTLNKPISMGYLPYSIAKKPGTEVLVNVRGRMQKGVVCDLPFVPTTYYYPNK